MATPGTPGSKMGGSPRVSSIPEDAVVFEITDQELAAADKYEDVAEYRRISVTLRSGDQAWVCVQA